MRTREQKLYEKLKKQHDKLYDKAKKLGPMEANPGDRRYDKLKVIQNQLIDCRLQMAQLASQTGDGFDYYALAMLYSEGMSFTGSKMIYNGSGVPDKHKIHINERLPDNFKLGWDFPFWEKSDEKTEQYLKLAMATDPAMSLWVKKDMLKLHSCWSTDEQERIRHRDILIDIADTENDLESIYEVGEGYYRGVNEFLQSFDRAKGYLLRAAVDPKTLYHKLGRAHFNLTLTMLRNIWEESGDPEVGKTIQNSLDFMTKHDQRQEELRLEIRELQRYMDENFG